MEKNQFLKVKLIKLSPDTNIHWYKGSYVQTVEGYTNKLPTLGESFNINSTFYTSEVIEELDKHNIFKTKNSTYKLEILE